MNNYKLQVKYVPTNSIIPYPNNNKLHPDDQINKIAGQISAFGFDQPIAIDKHNVIIKGHGRHLAAQKLGLDTVPVVVRDDLDEYQIKASRIGDNKVAQSEFDNQMLAFEFGTLERNGFDLSLTGFDPDEIQIIMSDDFKEGIVLGEINNTSKELDENSFQNFDHKCPKCGFEYDESANEQD